MKSFFSKILITLLSIVVVFSTLSFSVITHLCGGNAVSVSYFNEINFCEDEEDSCCNEREEKIDFCNIPIGCEDDHISEAPCCIDDNTMVEGTQYVTSFDSKKQLEKDVLSYEDYTPVVFNSYKSINLYNAVNYQPPIIKQNFQINFQSFLI